MTPCKFKAKCRNFMKGGKCEGWHVFDELLALKKKYRDSLSAQDAAMIAAAGGGGKKGGGKGKQKKGTGKGANGGCNTCGSMDHWARECPHAGPKPPDLALAVAELPPKRSLRTSNLLHLTFSVMVEGGKVSMGLTKGAAVYKRQSPIMVQKLGGFPIRLISATGWRV